MGKFFARAGAIFIALLFLLTSVGFSLFVIWQNNEQSKKDKQSAQVQQAIQDQQQSQNKEGKLEGTQLKNFTPVSHVEKLTVTDTVVGKGEAVKAGDTVTVHYTGAVAATGIIFQSSLDMGQPATFGLNQVIKGWTDGIPGMKVGGTRRLLIPADQAYGANPPQGSNIPPNADLVFDVQLLKIGQ